MITLTIAMIFIGFLVTISSASFVTASTTESHVTPKCPSFAVECDDWERPKSCPSRNLCCKFVFNETRYGFCTYLASISVKCPITADECHSNSSSLKCSNGGICCQHRDSAGIGQFCRCPRYFEGTQCQHFSDQDFPEVHIITETTQREKQSTTYTTYTTLRSDQQSEGVSTPNEKTEHRSISLTTFVAVVAVAVLVCIVSIVIAGLIYKRKYRPATPISKSDNNCPLPERQYQHLKTSQIQAYADLEVRDHYDTLDPYEGRYESIIESAQEDPNYSATQDNGYLDLVATQDNEDAENIATLTTSNDSTTTGNQSQQEKTVC